MKAIREILAALRKADDMYNLIEEGDKIVVGVSGGKDSLCLVRALRDYQRFSPVHFEFQPVILDMGFDNFDVTEIKKYIESLGLTLIVEECKDIYKILKAHTKGDNHLPCSICSRMRKATINRVALRLHYNKVAFAHHMDDALETLFMNEIYGARVATFSPKMHLEKTDIIFIRPFILVREKQIIRMVAEEEIPVTPSPCPSDRHTTREDIKHDLHEIYHKYPISYENFPTMLSKSDYFDLYYDKLEYRLDNGYVISPIFSKDQTLEFVKMVPRNEIKNIVKEDTQCLIYHKKCVGAFSLHETETEITLYNIHIRNKKDEVVNCLVAHFINTKNPKKISVK